MEDAEVVEVVVVVSVVAEVAEAVEVVDLEGDEEEGEEVDLEEDEVVEASPKAQVNSASFHVQSPGLQSRLGNIAHYVIFNLVCNWLIQRVCNSENISFKFGISLQLQKEQYKISREKRRPLARMIETR